jgi:hypothetical protein
VKKDQKKRISARGSTSGSPSPAPKEPTAEEREKHPEEDARPRGFDRGLQPERIIGED